MQACQVCGTADVDAGGYCTGCGQFRGTRSYSVDEPGVYGEPAYVAVGSHPVSPAASAGASPGTPVSPGAPQYPVSPAASPYAASPEVGYAVQPEVGYAGPYDGHYEGAADPAPERPARGLWATPLFLLTVMVVFLVAGTVSVVLIKTSDRGGKPANAAASPSVSATASPSASAVVDRCMVGDWAVTSLLAKSDTYELSTTNGGTFHLRADGTGNWDFGSGITLTGTWDGDKSEDLIAGRIEFKFRTVGQSFTFQDVRADVREVLTQGRNDPVNVKTPWALDVAEYICAGNATHMKIGNFDVQMGRK